LRGLKRKDLANNADAGRALADHELIAIWQALSKTNYPYGDFVKVLMLTGQRRSDWSDASRPEIDQQSRSLEIPAKRYKGQRDHVVPLSAAVQSIVGALPLWNEGAYLFSTTGGAKPFSGFSKAKEQLDCAVRASIPGLTNWRLHDLRVTCKTRMAKLGVASDIRDAVLGHAKRGLDRIYDKHERFDEKRAALDLYANHILSIVEGDR
jgi:integrase